ncbi:MULTISPECIES: hypothetical protein [unclassified Mycolicibacterium]|uniref:hypothetical protein n=1 Tax=unclassified Mycolicibacterium TaxID=2636767 RepID=UPI002EDB2369
MNGWDHDALDVALRRLPETYAMALRLTSQGASDDELCQSLGIEQESLSTLLQIAQQKLTSELNRPG